MQVLRNSQRSVQLNTNHLNEVFAGQSGARNTKSPSVMALKKVATLCKHNSVEWEGGVKNVKGRKMAVLWAAAQCRPEEIYRRFRGAWCLQHQKDDSGSTHLRNFGTLTPEYTALQPKDRRSILAAV
jgi:hypothetical protein